MEQARFPTWPTHPGSGGFPGGVLPCQAEGAFDPAGGHARSTWVLGIGQPAPSQVSVPLGQGLGLDEEPSHASMARQPAHSGEKRRVRRPQHRLSTRNLVTKQDHLYGGLCP